jgi:probable phosphoglycerate mutase
VLLVRHGRTPTTGRVNAGQTPGLHLSEDGRREAEAAAQRLGALRRLSAVYASPLERARETAGPIAERWGLVVQVEPGLIDGDGGDWNGAVLRELHRKPEWRLVRHHPSGFRFPGGESFLEIQTRMVSTLTRLVERHPGETIAAVSHADPIKLALVHALGAPLDLFQRLLISTASVTAIAFRREGPAVLTVNSTGADLVALRG